MTNVNIMLNGYDHYNTAFSGMQSQTMINKIIVIILICEDGVLALCYTPAHTHINILCT